MIQNLSVGSVVFDNQTYLLQRVIGLGFPSVENSAFDLPLRHGETLINSLLRRRVIVFEGVIVGSSSADLDDKVDALLEELDIDQAPFTFKFQTYNSENLQIYATVKNVDIEQEAGTLHFTRFRLELEAFDPLIYSQAKATATIYVGELTGGTPIPTPIPMNLSSGAGGGFYPVTNQGNFNAFPVYTVYGPGTGLHVRNVTADKAFFIDDTLTISDYVMVDVPNRTVRKNGSLNFDIFSGDWVDILPGTNNFFMYADSGSTSDSHCDVVHRHSYSGV